MRPCSKQEPCLLLFIEDEESIVDCFNEGVKLQTDAGFTTMSSRTLERGLEFLHTTKFRVCVVDLCLPDSSGMATLRRVSDETKGEVALVVFTSTDDPDFIRQAYGLGAQAYVVKNSMTFPALIRAIQDAVELHSYVMRWINTAKDLQIQVAVLDEVDQEISLNPGGSGVVSNGIRKLREVRRSMSQLVGARV